MKMLEAPKKEADFVKLEDDFGFTFITDQDMKERADNKLAEENKFLKAQIMQVKKDFNDYHDAVTTFLMKLGENPRAKTLVWPNRTQVVSELSDKLNKFFSPHWFK